MVVKVVDAGVTKLFTFVPSKKMYTLVLGLNPVPVNVIVLGLTNGIKDLLIIFEPNDSSVTFSTTEVLNPVLCWSVLVVDIVPVTPALNPPLPPEGTPPPRVTLVVVVPLQVVSQAFQTVPIAFLFALTTALKLPSTFTITTGATSVSNHSSPEGDYSITPVKLATRNGCTFSTFVAYGCCVKVVDV